MSTALVLAAGKATRLEGLREQYAKACVPVGDTTPLQHLLPRLHQAGVTRAWINLHWQAEQVREHALAAAPQGLELYFLEEPDLLGTGGTLLQVTEQDQLPEVVVNAKLFSDFDYAQLLAAPAGTVVLHPGSPLSEFGGLQFENDCITGLLPRAEAAATQTDSASQAAVFTGIAHPHHSWLDGLRTTPTPSCWIRHGLLPALAAGHPTHALLHRGCWCEISTPERVQSAKNQLAGLS